MIKKLYLFPLSVMGPFHVSLLNKKYLSTTGRNESTVDFNTTAAWRHGSRLTYLKYDLIMSKNSTDYISSISYLNDKII